MKANATIINSHFKNYEMSKIFRAINTDNISMITGSILTITDCLDKIWSDDRIFPYYPQERMCNTFKVISKSFGSRIEKDFKESDVWQSQFSRVRSKLNECMKLCTEWKAGMRDLTKINWK